VERPIRSRDVLSYFVGADISLQKDISVVFWDVKRHLFCLPLPNTSNTYVGHLLQNERGFTSRWKDLLDQEMSSLEDNTCLDLQLLTNNTRGGRDHIWVVLTRHLCLMCEELQIKTCVVLGNHIFQNGIFWNFFFFHFHFWDNIFRHLLDQEMCCLIFLGNILLAERVLWIWCETETWNPYVIKGHTDEEKNIF